MVILIPILNTGYSNYNYYQNQHSKKSTNVIADSQGAIIRKNPEVKNIYLIFTADEFADGRDTILKILEKHKIKGSFFLTGNFLRNPDFGNFISEVRKKGHYIGPHSDNHLLYCDWTKRDSLLVTRRQFEEDMKANYLELKKFGITKNKAVIFVAPYEWYNRRIADWTESMGITLVNLTPGTYTNADYTTPDMPNYKSSEEILERFLKFEANNPGGLNGCIVLIHLGTDPARTDKFYLRLDFIINQLTDKGYSFRKF